jgi:hypothetical protein
VRSRSVKRARQEREYAKLRAEWLPKHSRCEWPEGCDQAATDVHHRAGRSGYRLTDPSRWSALCRPHHMRATTEPAEAYRLGISERRIGEAS